MKVIITVALFTLGVCFVLFFNLIIAGSVSAQGWYDWDPATGLPLEPGQAYPGGSGGAGGGGGDDDDDDDDDDEWEKTIKRLNEAYPEEVPIDIPSD